MAVKVVKNQVSTIKKKVEKPVDEVKVETPVEEVFDDTSYESPMYAFAPIRKKKTTSEFLDQVMKLAEPVKSEEESINNTTQVNIPADTGSLVKCIVDSMDAIYVTKEELSTIVYDLVDKKLESLLVAPNKKTSTPKKTPNKPATTVVKNNKPTVTKEHTPLATEEKPKPQTKVIKPAKKPEPKKNVTVVKRK